MDQELHGEGCWIERPAADGGHGDYGEIHEKVNQDAEECAGDYGVVDEERNEAAGSVEDG